MANEPIKLFRGDDTDAFGLRTLTIKITGDLPLEGAYATFSLLGYSKSWTNSETKEGVLTMTFTSNDTRRFPVGTAYGTLRLYDGSKRLTVVNTIPFEITETVFGMPTQQYDLNVVLSVDTEINIQFLLQGVEWTVDGADKEVMRPTSNKIKRIVVPQLENVSQITGSCTLTELKHLVNTILEALQP